MSKLLQLPPMLVPIQKDVDNFLQRFAKERSSHCSSFITFKNIWHDMHLHLIYTCQPLEELLIFQDRLLDTVKSRLLPPFPSIWQLGAVYLLFAFTELVPFRRHLSIIQPRLMLDDLKGVQKLLRYLRVEEEFEATALFMYTLQNHCQIVAHPMSELYVDVRKQYSHRLSNTSDQTDLKSKTVTGSLKELTVDAYIQDQLDSFGFLKKMTATLDQYCALKSLIPDVKESSMCSLIGRDLVDNFSSSIVGMQKKSTHAQKKSTEEDLGEKRAQLKLKAFARESVYSRGGNRTLIDSKGDLVLTKNNKKAVCYPSVPAIPKKNYVMRRGGKHPVLDDQFTVEKTHRYQTTVKKNKLLRSASMRKIDIIIQKMAKRIKPEVP